jgi:putative Mn2+ efflux pump MntP
VSFAAKVGTERVNPELEMALIIGFALNVLTPVMLCASPNVSIVSFADKVGTESVNPEFEMALMIGFALNVFTPVMVCAPLRVTKSAEEGIWERSAIVSFAVKVGTERVNPEFEMALMIGFALNVFTPVMV